MSGEIPERVTCEVCGTSFDPTESRGWCPNTACGKWQHPAFPLSEGASDGRQGAADGGVDTPTKSCPSCGKDVRADANFCKFCSHEFEDDGEGGGGGDDEAGIDECPDCAADLSSIPPERLSDCPICGTDLGEVLADRTEPDVTPADLTACPACAADLTDIPEDMRMVCPDCRIDLREAIETDGVDGDGEQSAAGGAAAPDTTEAGQADEGTADAAEAAGGGDEAPEDGAETPVDTIKGIGSSYADRLADAGVETAGDLVAADLADLSASTDISEKRLGEWVERAPVGPAEVDAADGDEATADDADEETPADTGSDAGQADEAAGTADGPSAGTGQPTDAGTGDGSGAADQDAGMTSGKPPGAGQGTPAGPKDYGGPAGRTEETGTASSGGAEPETAGQSGGGDGNPTGRRGSHTSVGGSGAGTPADEDDVIDTQIQPNYDTVVLEVMGQEIRAESGDAIGREIRTAMVEGGAPDDDAVYIHREHVRVDEDDGRFYFTRLGQNSLKVNDEPVAQHERAPVTDGDEVSFSEVVTADIRLE
jgi:hypothetical protein